MREGDNFAVSKRLADIQDTWAPVSIRTSVFLPAKGTVNVGKWRGEGDSTEMEAITGGDWAGGGLAGGVGGLCWGGRR